MSVEAPSHAHALASIRVLIVLEQTIRAGLMPTFKNRESAKMHGSSLLDSNDLAISFEG